jgi:hypothetical protein
MHVYTIPQMCTLHIPSGIGNYLSDQHILSNQAFYDIFLSYHTLYVLILPGTYKVRNEIETKRNETKRNQRKRNETKRNETKRNEINKNGTKRNEINEMKTK